MQTTLADGCKLSKEGGLKGFVPIMSWKGSRGKWEPLMAKVKRGLRPGGRTENPYDKPQGGFTRQPRGSFGCQPLGP